MKDWDLTHLHRHMVPRLPETSGGSESAHPVKSQGGPWGVCGSLGGFKCLREGLNRSAGLKRLPGFSEALVAQEPVLFNTSVRQNLLCLVFAAQGTTLRASEQLSLVPTACLLFLDLGLWHFLGEKMSMSGTAAPSLAGGKCWKILQSCRLSKVWLAAVPHRFGSQGLVGFRQCMSLCLQPALILLVGRGKEPGCRLEDVDSCQISSNSTYMLLSGAPSHRRFQPPSSSFQ